MMTDWMSGILIWHQVTSRYPEESLKELNAPGAVIYGGKPLGPTPRSHRFRVRAHSH